MQLAIAERAEQEAEQRWRQQHGRGSGQQQYQRSREKRGGGLLGSVPPEVRRAALNLIDYQLTPVLVDQWRCALLTSPAAGPCNSGSPCSLDRHSSTWQ